ncbi:MAG TPA: CopG family transcriptional regulator [Chloroflexota bacterium]|jgi:hypothetical protein
MAVAHKKAVQIYLRPEQLEALRALARRRELPVAELVRQGVDKVLGEVPPEEDPLWGIIGMFKSGVGDLAEKHDQYIAEIIEAENS